MRGCTDGNKSSITEFNKHSCTSQRHCEITGRSCLKPHFCNP